MKMKKASVLFLAAVLCTVALPVSAQMRYTGEYNWLRFWDGVGVDASSGSYYGWGLVWAGPRDSSASPAQWYKLSWNSAMALTGAQMEVRADLYGRGSTLGEFQMQYQDMAGGWHDLKTEVIEKRVAAGSNSVGDIVNPASYDRWALDGGGLYTLRFHDMPSTGVQAIRVCFPEDSYTHITDPDLVAKGEPAYQQSPAIFFLLPQGNRVSGGLDTSDPTFNILATNKADHFLGINPTVTLRDGSGNVKGDYTDLFTDNILSYDSPRLGVNPGEIIVCDLGENVDERLVIHGVTLYTGTMTQHFITDSLTMDVYVTDDLNDLGELIGTAGYMNGTLSYSGFEAAGRYVVLKNLSATSYFTELAINATAPVPEPATMALLALGGLAMLRRRR